MLEQGEIRQLRILGDPAEEIGSAVLFEIDGIKYVPQHDLRGNVALLLSPAGKAEVYRYSAFGEELFQESVSPWRFSSKRVDEETGWVYFGRRYYAPSWGRWTTADPAWFADGPNLYAYVHNNPLRYVDPDGLSAIEHQQMNRPGTQGTFFGSFSRGILDDTSWGASSWMLGDYVCDNWQSSLGYGMGTGVSMMTGLVYGGTEAKLLGVAGKGLNWAARWLNFADKEVKAM